MKEAVNNDLALELADCNSNFLEEQQKVSSLIKSTKVLTLIALWRLKDLNLDSSDKKKTAPLGLH